MYTDRVPLHDIDLRRPERERWRDVMRRERAVARRQLRSLQAGAPMLGRALLTLFGKPFQAAYALSGGRYGGEMAAIAEDVGIPTSQLLLLNCSYEMSHAWGRLSAFGCTAGVRWLSGHGLVHVRSMDWPLPQVGHATRLFRYRDGRRAFTSVGILGHVGVLSGMLPGAYSVTLNWAPPTRLPRFQWGPAFLLRVVLETCDTYDDAVAALADAELATSVFFLVAGTRRGEACIIERTPDVAAVREMRGDVLVGANHHVARKFLRHNDGIAEGTDEYFSLLETSEERADVLERELRVVRPGVGIDDVARCLDVDPVCNDDSYQQMAFCPRTGALRAWRWVRGGGSR